MDWTALGSELGLTFKPGIRAFLESDAVRRLETGDPQQAQAAAQARKLLDNPLVAGLLDRVFTGVLTGQWQGYEAVIYRGARASGGSSGSHPSVTAALLFNQPPRCGLQVRERLLADRLLAWFGRRGLPTGNAALDRAVHISAREIAQAQVTFSDARVQQHLLTLQGLGGTLLLTDEGIRRKRQGETLDATEARRVLDAQAAFAQSAGW